MKTEGYIAFDFGASSGRMMFGTLVNGKLQLDEIHRFENTPVYIGDTFYWDFPRLFHEMKLGLKKIAKRDVLVKGIGIDTWGVDIGWLDDDGKLLSNPIHYRDERTNKIIAETETLISEDVLYKKTGISKMSFNTVYQVYYDKKKNNSIKTCGKTMLYTPDLFGYFLSGEKYNEFTIASTGSLINVVSKDYDSELFNLLDINNDFTQRLVMPGTIVGSLCQTVQDETGLGAIPIIATAGHDTACAVAATPLENEETAYLICGTWSLIGLELEDAITTESARKAGFTNEGGVEGTIRFLKNINGLFFIQSLKKDFEKRVSGIGYPEISNLASQANHDYTIDVTDNRFMNPMSMERAIVDYCQEKYGVKLESIGDIARAAYNGLAHEYKSSINQLESVTGKKISSICMVGGGIQDQFLCSHVSNSLNQKVYTGPTEASVLGNILMQMKALGEIKNRFEGRTLVK